MAFFNELGKKVTQSSQTVIQKTKNFADATKLGGIISDEEKQIENLYGQIGRLYVSVYKNEYREEFVDMIESVHRIERIVEENRIQAEMLKGAKKCPKCGTLVPYNSAFCNACGFEMPTKAENKPVIKNGIKCEKCGKVVAPNMKFCTGCGNPMPANLDNNNLHEESLNVTRCQNCGEAIEDGLAFCTNCGYKLNDKEPEIISEHSDINEQKICNVCGSTVPDDSMFCTECGNKI